VFRRAAPGFVAISTGAAQIMAGEATPTRWPVVQRARTVGGAPRQVRHPVQSRAEVMRARSQEMLTQDPKTGAAPDLEAADLAARNWRWPVPGTLPIGSEAHRDAACQMFFDTFNPYRPSVIDWPLLSDEARARLISLPIWDIAVQTEGKARLRMRAYAQSATDPAWRDAIERNAWEENRHKEVLSKLVSAYGIALAPEPLYHPPRDPEWAYLVTGFSECIDSFFAFGLFDVAKRSGFFPPELVDTFEPVIQEEARHILLFANWLAWQRRQLPWWRRAWFELRVAAVWVFLAWERIGLARGMATDGGAAADNNFTLTGSRSVSDVDIGVVSLMAVCLAENDRRFAGYDRRLLRPTTTPAIARLVCWLGSARERWRGKPSGRDHSEGLPR
jgi:hypothetical protein